MHRMGEFAQAFLRGPTRLCRVHPQPMLLPTPMSRYERVKMRICGAIWRTAIGSSSAGKMDDSATYSRGLTGGTPVPLWHQEDDFAADAVAHQIHTVAELLELQAVRDGG